MVIKYIKKWNAWCKRAEDSVVGFSDEDFANTLVKLISFPILLIMGIMPFWLQLKLGGTGLTEPIILAVLGVLIMLVAIRTMIAYNFYKEKY
jgi:hypothetical protein